MRRAVIVTVDGLRKDMISSELTPNLARFAGEDIGELRHAGAVSPRPRSKHASAARDIWIFVALEIALRQRLGGGLE